MLRSGWQGPRNLRVSCSPPSDSVSMMRSGFSIGDQMDSRKARIAAADVRRLTFSKGGDQSLLTSAATILESLNSFRERFADLTDNKPKTNKQTKPHHNENQETKPAPSSRSHRARGHAARANMGLEPHGCAVNRA